MKRILILTIISFLLVGCVTYRQPARPQIVSVLAIDSKGDTIQVSTDYLEREFRTNPGNYSNWRFQWENSWYWGNGWFYSYNPYWYNPRYYYPRRPIIVQPQPRVHPQPRRDYNPRSYQPRTPQVQPNRGRSNSQPWVTPQQPPRVQPQQPRPTRPTTPSRNNNNTQHSPRTRGGEIIKQ